MPIIKNLKRPEMILVDPNIRAKMAALGSSKMFNLKDKTQAAKTTGTTGRVKARPVDYVGAQKNFYANLKTPQATPLPSVAPAPTGYRVGEYTNPYQNLDLQYTDIEQRDFYDGLGQEARPEYQNQYTDELQRLYNQMNDQGQFDYDLNADMVYQQMLDRYTGQGRRAAQDAQGQAAALTGGYGNTWAQTAGQQAYNQHLQAMHDAVPALRNAAFQEWLAEQNRLQQAFQNTRALQSDEYGQYRDRMSDFESDRAYQANLAGARENSYYNWLNAQLSQEARRNADAMDLAGMEQNAYRQYVDWKRQEDAIDRDSHYRDIDYNLAAIQYQNQLNQQAYENEMARAQLDEDSYYRWLQAKLQQR